MQCQYCRQLCTQDVNAYHSVRLSSLERRPQSAVLPKTSAGYHRQGRGGMHVRQEDSSAPPAARQALCAFLFKGGPSTHALRWPPPLAETSTPTASTHTPSHLTEGVVQAAAHHHIMTLLHPQCQLGEQPLL